MSPRSGPLLVEGCLRPWADRLVDLVGPRPLDRCLDVMSDDEVMTRRLVRTGALVDRAGVPSDARRGRLYHVVVSLFGLAHTQDPVAALDGLVARLRPGGRLAVALWAGAAGAPHEQALGEVLRAEAGVKSGFLDTILACGEPGGPLSRLGSSLRAAPLKDVIRFDGVDHLWAALVDERPVAAEIAGVDPAGVASARSALAARAQAWAGWDGTLRIPVEAVVVQLSG